MPSYVCFLRAINLGATRKFPRDDVAASAERAGFTDVATYLNTGNGRVSTPMRSRVKVEAALEAAFEADRGFAVPTVAFTPAEVRDLAEAAGRIAAEHPDAVRHYITLLRKAPGAAARAAVEALAEPGVHVEVTARAVHVVPDHVLGRGGPQSDRVERLLGVGTTRNRTVVEALAQRWC